MNESKRWRLARFLVLSVLATALVMAPTGDTTELCVGLTRPVQGPVERVFAPAGRYSGHWGVDWAVAAGTPVRASGRGTVSFAGVVAGNLTVTVDHGGGLRTSYSYLAEVVVRRGDSVSDSTTLGSSGTGHGVAALHFSVRVGDTYLDPLPVIACRLATPSQALRLVPVREIA